MFQTMNIFEAYEKHRGEKIRLPHWKPERWIRWDFNRKQWVNEEGFAATLFCHRQDYELWQPKTYTNEEAFLLLKDGHTVQKEGYRPTKRAALDYIFFADNGMPTPDLLIAEMFAIPGE